MENFKRDIFEDLIDNLPRCQYISDLRSMIEKEDTVELYSVIRNMNADDYSITQWSELIQYLFKNHYDYLSTHKAYQDLLTMLKK